MLRLLCLVHGRLSMDRHLQDPPASYRRSHMVVRCIRAPFRRLPYRTKSMQEQLLL
jgi:hypothetical protein